ncbi:BTAD domain-containing putative transcriptional regulator [Streptomyces sp. NPDC050439]|uniref:BTAD domain-containing putative transcriptional regulator n=1 Tax=unclassified Streptomyces TaxID=2593676 RepID=UPI0034430E30
MKICLLGPLEVTAGDAEPLALGGVRLRMLLARLALEGGRPVSVDALVDGLWGEQPPADAGNALQALVSRLRKALRGAGTVEAVAGGYRVTVDADDVDAHRFEALAAQGRRELAAERPAEAASTLADALALWRGPALTDILDAPFARPAAARLDDLRTAAAEDRFDAELRIGRYADVLADLESAGAERPLSERTAALRMRALSAAGRNADALGVYEEMRGRLDDELGVDPSAELKAVHLALLRGELKLPPARTGAAPAPDRLPARLTSFVGRDAELDEVAALLAASRLVTLVGPGGAGKTRLALEAVTRHRAHRLGRVWFVPLAGVGTPDQLADAVHAALSTGSVTSGGGGPAGGGAGVDRVTEVLDVGETVLVLDNCEHLVEASADLAHELLERLPHLSILATSREPLAITGEALCHLGPLGVPTGTPELAEAADSAAVRLFTDRASGVRPGFALDASTVDPVVEICRRLDGLPLALELAAAKLRSMSVGQIARRLDDRFRLLTSGSRTALPRQRTLHALVEWSWDLLDEPERLLARRLSVFPGGATVAALEAVCSDETLPADDVLYVLGSLVEKSLVETSDDADGEQRYRMSETVRAFAAGRLAEAEAEAAPLPEGGAGARTADRFATYFLALAEHHEPALRTGDQLRSLALFDAEHDNLVAALRGAFEARDAALASRFVRALFWYWGIRGMSTQFETFLAEVLTFDEALPGRARAAFRVVRLMAGTPGAADSDDIPVRTLIEDCERADAGEFHPALLLWIPMLAFLTGNSDLGESGLRRAAERPEPWVRATAHWARDFVLTGRGEQPAGAEARRAALEGFEAVGDRWGLGLALLAVGGDHSLRGEHGEAIAAYAGAVAVSGELGAEDDLFNSLARLAAERLRSGDREGALRDIHAAQRQAKERGYRRMEAEMLFSLADLHRRSGEWEQADLILDRLDSVADRLTLPDDMARDLIAGARMANRLAQGDTVRARELLPRAVSGAFARGEVADIARAAELLARLLLSEGDAAGAATALGMSQVVRGVFDEGDPQLRELVGEVTGRLGAAGYEEAYGLGAGLPRADALNRLTGEAGQPVTSYW